MWFIYALLSALFAAFRRTNEKQLSHQLHHFTIGWTVQLCSLPVLVIAMLVTGSWLDPSQLGWKFWLPTVVVILGFYPLNTYLYLNAIKHGELSQLAPLQSLGPVFSLLTGLVFLGQIPGVASIPCVMLIIAGIYVLNIDTTHPLQPFKVLVSQRSSLLFIAVVLQGALVGVIDATALQASNALYYSVISTCGAVIVLYAITKFRGVSERPAVAQHSTSLAIAGLLLAGSYGSFLLAIADGPVGYVSAVRSSSMVMGALLGVVNFKEKLSTAKIISLGLVSLGAMMLSFT